jgi:anti-sigma regulatory factor (Ser/Thr protein kinase)
LQSSGAEVDDRGVAERPDRQLILPLTRFHTEANVDHIANEALDSLSNAGVGSANLYPVVSEIFAELALNAVQHSESEIGAFGLIQFYESEHGRRFVCVVADGGIGIRQSLARNPDLRERVPYDWVAIEVALQEGVSGTGSRTRGIGLYGVAEDMRKAGRQLIIHSGIGMLQTSEEMERAARRTTLFPGTLAFASIPT